MVLSNKKLKQKLREDLSKPKPVAVASETNLDSAVASFQSQSLKKLLDSASHKPRLSKREKRRINPCPREQPVRKKRKRDDSVEEEKLEEEGEETEKKSEELGEEEEGEKTEKKSKKKKQKKRKVNKVDVEEKVKVEEVQVDTESKEEDGIVPKKVYVGGIPYQSTEDEIRSYFRSCGVITKVDCKMRPEDGAFTGIAFITFETEDGAKRALAFDRAAMGDRYLTIQQYVKTTPSVPRKRTSSGFVPEMVDGYNRVYIGNLAWDTTERDIRKLFSDCVINSVRLGKNKETGEFKGYAHVDFKDSVSVAMALKLDQHVISGRPVKICCALKERPVGPISTNTTPDETNNVDSYNMGDTYAATDPIPAPNGFSDGNYFAATVSSGKVKRRVCYECGEKGHLSTACPKKLQNAVDQANTKVDQETVITRPAMQSYDYQQNYGSSYMNETYAATNEATNGTLEFAASTGKVKRRNCYECGEKGHLSTACPKKLQNVADQANTKLEQETINTRPAMQSYDHQQNYGGSYLNETYAATDEANHGSLAFPVSTGKVKRRNCYECGEKGHLSTACPKKLQNTDHTNSNLYQQNTRAEPVQVTSYNLQNKSGYNENYGDSYMDETYATDSLSVAATTGANDGSLAPTASGGKIKRRNCYECGEKGHLSSACPKKQQN